VWIICRPRLFFRLRSLLLAGCLALLGSGCARDQNPKILDVAYVRGSGVVLRDQLGPASGVLATLQGGEKVEVLARRNRWVQVRLAGRQTGWVHSRFLASQKVVDQFQELAGKSQALTGQGKALIRREANLHLDADGGSETFHRLVEHDPVDILTHRLAERVDRPPGGNRSASVPDPATGSEEDESDAGKEEPVTVEVRAPEDWFLVRASGGRVGWLREGFLDMAPPIEVARYSEGLRIRAWFVLYEEHDNNGVHPWYLWATIHPRPGLPFDFDEIRVFVWDPVRSRYETSYRERNLIGFYPIEARNMDTPEGQAPAFSLQLEDPAGRRFQKSYRMSGRVVKSQP
jgi:SH3 domain-containing protein